MSGARHRTARTAISGLLIGADDLSAPHPRAGEGRRLIRSRLVVRCRRAARGAAP